MTANRLLFAAILGVLVALVVAMLWLSTGAAGSVDVLRILVATLVGAGAIVLLLRFARSTRR